MSVLILTKGYYEDFCSLCGVHALVREITPSDKGLESHIAGLICLTCERKEHETCCECH